MQRVILTRNARTTSISDLFESAVNDDQIIVESSMHGIVDLKFQQFIPTLDKTDLSGLPPEFIYDELGGISIENMMLYDMICIVRLARFISPMKTRYPMPQHHLPMNLNLHTIVWIYNRLMQDFLSRSTTRLVFHSPTDLTGA